MQAFELVLASSSPRRQWLLQQAGYRFAIARPTLDESKWDFSSGIEEALQRLAFAKSVSAEKGSRSARDHKKLYLSADTIVVLRQQVLGKPSSQADAYKMLKSLSGQMHRVFTAWVLAEREGENLVPRAEGISCSSVTWFHLDEATLQAASSSDECMDKAGAYAFQGQALTWIQSISGSPANVMGLPIGDIVPHLDRFNIPRWTSS